MDAVSFDRLTQSLATMATRRTAVRGLAGGVLALAAFPRPLAPEDATANHKKKKKKKKPGQVPPASPPSPPDSPPPPPPSPPPSPPSPPPSPPPTGPGHCDDIHAL